MGPPIVSSAVLQLKRLTDTEAFEKLKNMEPVERGRMPLLTRRYQFDLAFGRNMCAITSRPLKDVQSWMKQGTTSKAASLAGPPTSAARSSSSVSGLTQQFEQLSVKEVKCVGWSRTHP